MYAILETGGKQFNVKEGDILRVEKLKAEVGAAVEMDKVLAVGRENGITLGKPYVDGAKVVLKVLEQGKGKKVMIYKYKPKKKSRKLRGHRQPYTKVVVDKIMA